MAEYAQTLIDITARRVRDPGLTANTRAFIRDILSRSQRAVNAHLRRIFSTATLTTTRRTMLYPIQGNLASAVEIDEILYETDYRLEKIPWRSLMHGDWEWHRAIKSDMLAFSVIGRDLLLLYPGLNRDSSVEVGYVKLTNKLVAEDTQTEIPDEDMLSVLALSEAILLMKARMLDSAETELRKVEQVVGINNA